MFPLLITVGYTFALFITVGNGFPLAITLVNMFPLLTTVGKNNVSSFVQKKRSTCEMSSMGHRTSQKKRVPVLSTKSLVFNTKVFFNIKKEQSEAALH